MNKARREKISDIVSKLQDCRSELETIQTEEDDSRYNMPENLEGSQRYTESEEASDALDSANSDIENAINTLEEITT
mgnify:CR=1 FL=1